MLQNRPSGECFVQMTSVDDAYKAQELLHRKYMDKRYVEVFQVGVVMVGVVMVGVVWVCSVLRG